MSEITADEVYSSLTYIKNAAPQIAAAKANRIHLEQFRKTQKALLMQEVEGAEHTKAAYAYSHEDYRKVLDGLKVAVEEEEKIKFLINSAQLLVEVYRTQQANNRFIDKVHT